MIEWLNWIFISTLYCRYHGYPLFTDKKSKAQRIHVTCSRLWWVVETGFEPCDYEIRAIIIKWMDEVCAMPGRRHKGMIAIYLGSEASHDPLKEKKMICWVLTDHLLCGRLCFKCVHLVNPLWYTLNSRFINSFYRKSNQGSEKQRDLSRVTGLGNQRTEAFVIAKLLAWVALLEFRGAQRPVGSSWSKSYSLRFLPLLLPATTPFQKAMWHQRFTRDVAQIMSEGQGGFTLTLLPGSPGLTDPANMGTLEPEFTSSSTIYLLFIHKLFHLLEFQI